MNKQIEGMATVLLDQFEGMIAEADATAISVHLFNNGYQKSTDVAREIFEEIMSIAKVKYWRGGVLTELVVNAEDYAILRKKYESEGADDDRPRTTG